MEILVILGIVVLVGGVLLYRRSTGKSRETDVSTGNPPSSKGSSEDI